MASLDHNDTQAFEIPSNRSTHHSLDLSTMFTHAEYFPSALFGVNETGPGVLSMEELLPEDFTDDLLYETLLHKMSISFISALAMGHEYIEGVFDLPAGNSEKYRIMLVTFKLPNPSAIDNRLLIGYYQIAIFIPRQLHKIVPPYTTMENVIVSIVKSTIRSSSNISITSLSAAKEKILGYVGSTIRASEVLKSINAFI